MKGAVEGLPTRALMDLPSPAGGPTFRGGAALMSTVCIRVLVNVSR